MLCLHPWISKVSPLDQSVYSVLASFTSSDLLPARSVLFSHLWHLPVLEHTIKLALQTSLGASPSKLLLEALKYLVPTLSQIGPAVPDKVRMFLGPCRARITRGRGPTQSRLSVRLSW